jgi:hypothetical protein
VSSANNQMGHGFYQFSPELFHRVLSTENGFRVRAMYIATHSIRTHCIAYRIPPFSAGEWNSLTANRPACTSSLNESCDPLARHPQQIDYAATWAGSFAAVESPHRWRGVMQRMLPNMAIDAYRGITAGPKSSKGAGLQRVKGPVLADR